MAGLAGAFLFPLLVTNAGRDGVLLRGLLQLHSFQYAEARESFRDASAKDPKCRMALGRRR